MDQFLLQAQGLSEILLELRDVVPVFFNYVLKTANIVLVIWIVAVIVLFYSVPAVRLASIAGVFFGIFQSMLVFGVENQDLYCSEVICLLWFCTAINLINLFSPLIMGATTLFWGRVFLTLNPIHYSLSVLTFSAITFVVLDNPYSLSNFSFEDFFTWSNFYKSILTVSVCA